LCNYSFQYSRAATILYHRKQIAEAMYYNSFQYSRAATILYHRKQTAEAMWGRLVTCGRLLIGLPRPARNLPGRWLWACGLPHCGAGWQNLRPIVKIGLPLSPENLRLQWLSFAACRYAGQVGNLRPIGNRPAATCP
jgi:hypothetical protein